MMANQGMLRAMMRKSAGSHARAGLAAGRIGKRGALCGGGRRMERSPWHGT